MCVCLVAKRRVVVVVLLVGIVLCLCAWVCGPFVRAGTVKRTAALPVRYKNIHAYTYNPGIRIGKTIITPPSVPGTCAHVCTIYIHVHYST